MGIGYRWHSPSHSPSRIVDNRTRQPRIRSANFPSQSPRHTTQKLFFTFPFWANPLGSEHPRPVPFQLSSSKLVGSLTQSSLFELNPFSPFPSSRARCVLFAHRKPTTPRARAQDAHSICLFELSSIYEMCEIKGNRNGLNRQALAEAECSGIRDNPSVYTCLEKTVTTSDHNLENTRSVPTTS